MSQKPTFRKVEQLSKVLVGSHSVVAPNQTDQGDALQLVRGTVMSVNNTNQQSPAVATSYYPINVTQILNQSTPSFDAISTSAFGAQITTASPHALSTGDWVFINGVGQGGMSWCVQQKPGVDTFVAAGNGPFLVTYNTATSFYIQKPFLATAPVTPGNGPPWLITTGGPTAYYPYYNNLLPVYLAAPGTYTSTNWSTALGEAFIFSANPYPTINAGFRAPYTASVVIGSNYFLSVPWIGDEAPTKLPAQADPFFFQTMLVQQGPSLYILGPQSQFPLITDQMTGNGYGTAQVPMDGKWTTLSLYSPFQALPRTSPTSPPPAPPRYKVQGNKLYLSGVVYTNTSTVTMPTYAGGVPLAALPPVTYIQRALGNGQWGSYIGEIPIEIDPSSPATSSQLNVAGFGVVPTGSAQVVSYLYLDGIVFHID